MANAKDQPAQRALLEAQVTGPGETTLADVAERVGRAVAEAEVADERSKWAERFASSIAERRFLPSVPTLANASRSGQLAACFALEVDDTLESIYGTLRRAALIQQGSGGVGIEFSALRPRGTPITRSGGHTPGPVAFCELFAHSAHSMALAGRRSGAHLAILRDDHPDIVDFVRARRDAPERFPQLGMAVSVSDWLLRAGRSDDVWMLSHPHGESAQISARTLLTEIAKSILASGNPTLLFRDRMEIDNPTPALGALRATNPCGEQPLLFDESCVLGSLHLPAFVDSDGSLDEDGLARVVWDAVRFLDDALTVNLWPDEQIERASLRTRKIGLGVMGLADFLLLHDVHYDSEAGRALSAEVLGFIARETDAATRALGEERGAYPACRGNPRQRHATTRAFAPTGTLRLLAGCSAGIEPFFDARVELSTDTGTLSWTDPWLLRWLERRRVDPGPVLDALAAGAGYAALPGLAADDRALLRQAWEISAEDQIAMQATAQRHVDGAVSKTVQLDPRASPSPDAVVDWIQKARSLGCKGVAFYCGHRESGSTRIDLRSTCRVSCADGAASRRA